LPVSLTFSAWAVAAQAVVEPRGVVVVALAVISLAQMFI
jgi:hypothetical protein